MVCVHVCVYVCVENRVSSLLKDGRRNGKRGFQQVAFRTKRNQPNWFIGLRGLANHAVVTQRVVFAGTLSGVILQDLCVILLEIGAFGGHLLLQRFPSFLGRL